MTNPLVSILIPCFNCEKYIKQAVESCLGQVWKEIEIIVVDDGSSDRSVEILNSIKDQRIKIILQENQGASAARNNAYKHSQGKYIQYLDSDDLLCRYKIKNQVMMLEREKPGMVALSNTVYFMTGKKQKMENVS